MNELLKKIISIEEKAQQIIESAHDEKRDIEKQMEEESEHLEKDIVHKQEKKIKELQNLEFSAAEEEANKVHAHTKTQIEEMDKIANAHMEQWVEDLFKAVVSR